MHWPTFADIRRQKPTPDAANRVTLRATAIIAMMWFAVRQNSASKKRPAGRFFFRH